MQGLFLVFLKRDLESLVFLLEVSQLVLLELDGLIEHLELLFLAFLAEQDSVVLLESVDLLEHSPDDLLKNE